MEMTQPLQTKNSPLLSINDLTVEFKTEKGVVRAVDSISFDLASGEPLGIVGESGCGKSVTALSLLKLIPSPPGRIAGGEILLDGQNIVPLSDSRMRGLRGNKISMIFQEPMTALNPVYTIGNQMIEILRIHKNISRQEARNQAVEILNTVEIESPEKRIKQYPHELSGGMRQRVMIAMALSCNPKILVADEPTTALDVTVQAQVMDEIKRLQKKLDMAVILITHDLGVIAEFCRRVIVMYCGKIVEIADTESLFKTPRHPYTKGLLDSIPRIRDQKLEKLPTIKGMVPDLADLPKGCRYADRCPKARERCRKVEPVLEKDLTDRSVSCFYPN
jgi:peptide/nickel transport system ATP-binding protein